MRHQEKKYKVESFGEIEAKLTQVGAVRQETTVTFHYYGVQESLDATKMVFNGNIYEIHVLKEADGKFTLTDRFVVSSRDEGFAWLKDHGFSEYQEVKMETTDYECDGGLVGLYVINDSFLSVILDYPADQHEAMEKIFGLENAELVTMPYNKFLSIEKKRI